MRFQTLSVHLIALVSLLTISRSAWAIQFDFETDTQVPIVYLNLAIKGGSVTDPEKKSGLNYFLGRMLLRGTQIHSQEEIDELTDQMGAVLDVDIRTESLIFRGAVLKTEIKKYLSLWKEILTTPTFPDHEIEKLKALQLSILDEERENDAVLASRFFKRSLFPHHPYGRPTSGTQESIRSFTREDVKNLYEERVRNSSLILIGSGDYTNKELGEWATDLGNLRPDQEVGTASHKAAISDPEPSPKRRFVIVDKPDRIQTQINIGQIGVSMCDSQFFPLFLGNEAFGSFSFISTLMDEIRVKRGWSYGASSYFGFGLHPRSWQVHTFPSSQDTPETVRLAHKLIADLKDNGLTQEKFDFAKESFLNKSGFMYNTPEKRVENRLIEKTLELPDHYIRSYADQIQKVSLPEVNRALRAFLTPDKLVTVILGTAKYLKKPLAQAVGIPVESIEIVPYTSEQ